MFTFISISLAYASSGGIFQKTLRYTAAPGCGNVGCHAGQSANPASTNTTVTITGPNTLTTNQTGDYTVTLSYSPTFTNKSGGFNVATKSGAGLSSTDNGVKSGTVQPGNFIELTHNGKKSLNTNTKNVSWTFKYTAPSAAGIDTLYATGNVVNNSGGADVGDEWNHAAKFAVTITAATSVNDEKNLVPKEIVLHQNYPNPFNPSTKIQYELPTASTVKLEVLNTAGQLVAILDEGTKSAGSQTVLWNIGKDGFASGVYFYRLEVTPKNNPNNRSVLVKKMLFVK